MEERVPSNREISAYYDEHADRVQLAVGVNMRHRSILHRLDRAGMRSTHRVLEIGCGVGTMTGLILKRVSKGQVVGVDISTRAIEAATKRFGSHGHATFLVSDMEGLDLEQKFDIILLPDVLEHIPEEKHQDLFRTIEHHLAPDGTVCIHIPDPDSIQWMRMHRPDRLQIVDQPLAIAPMVERFKACGLLLERYERYGLWTEEADYDWIEFRRQRPALAQTQRGYLRLVIDELRHKFRAI